MGNGGSSCDAAHVAVEFLHPVTAGRPALAAINLAADAATLSALGNDLGFEHVFLRQIMAQGRAGDGLIGISTSGNSANLLAAFAKAKEIGIVTIGLCGGDGGRMQSSGVGRSLPGGADTVDPSHPGVPRRSRITSCGTWFTRCDRRIGADEIRRRVPRPRQGDGAGARNHRAGGAPSDRSRPIQIMEVCGGHTHAIFRYGIEGMLPEQIELVHGPGCPVCVLPMGRIDDCIAIASQPGVILTTFGDAMRVPGSRGSLLQAKANGADIRMVYSPIRRAGTGARRTRIARWCSSVSASRPRCRPPR